MIKIDEIQLYNPGIYRTKILDDDFTTVKQELLNEIEKGNLESGKQNVVGHIEKILNVKPSNNLKRILTDFIFEYCKNFNFIHKPDHLSINDTAWINLQKKYEFNPIHTHPGVLSWILWLQIPYNLEEELSLPISFDTSSKRTSLLEFSYSRLDGGKQQFPLFIDKTWEGGMLMFPSDLEHTVYPFYTSDSCRISVSGNIKLIK